MRLIRITRKVGTLLVSCKYCAKTILLTPDNWTVAYADLDDKPGTYYCEKCAHKQQEEP